MTEAGTSRAVELSLRLRVALAASRPDTFRDDTLTFPSEAGGFLDPHNFRRRVFNSIVEKALGADALSRATNLRPAA